MLDAARDLLINRFQRSLPASVMFGNANNELKATSHRTADLQRNY